MNTFHNFTLEIETVGAKRVVKLNLNTRNAIDVCMYTWFTFPDTKYLF